MREHIYQRLEHGFIDCFLHIASTYPDNIAFEIPENDLKLSYRDLLSRIEQMKAMLERIKITKGDLVCLLLDSPPDFVLSFLALVSIEAVTMPVSVTLTSFELEQIFQLGKPKYIISNAEFLERYHSTIEKFNDIKCIISLDTKISPDNDRKRRYECFNDYHGQRSGLTSPEDGSFITCHFTYRGFGYPLGVCHSYQDYNFCMQGLLNVIISEPGWTALSFLPAYQIYGTLMIGIFPMIIGLKVVYVKNIMKNNFVDLCKKYDVKITYFIPVFLKKLLKDAELLREKGENFQLNPETQFFSSGSYLNEELTRQIHEQLNINIRQAYGSTETLAITLSSGFKDRGTFGLPIREEIKVKICDAAGKTLEAGHIGEIVIQSPSVAVEFKSHPNATAAFFKNDCFYSGDIGYLDDDGILHFIGRAIKIAKNNSQMVDLKEVSSIIRLLEDVEEVYTTTENSLLLKQKVISFVILKKESEINAKEIRMHCLAYLSKYKAPTEIYLYKRYGDVIKRVE